MRLTAGTRSDESRPQALEASHSALQTPGSYFKSYFKGSWPQFMREWRQLESSTSPFGSWA